MPDPNDAISLPSSPAPMRCEWDAISASDLIQNPASFAVQGVDYGGRMLTCGVTLPTMARERGEEWVAALLKAKNGLVPVLFGDPIAVEPMGAWGGTPFVYLDQSSGARYLVLTELPVSQADTVKAGDWIQICPNQIVEPSAIDSSGWVKNQCTITPNIADIEETLTADRLVPAVDATDAYVNYTTGALDGLPGKTFTASVWLRATSGTPTIKLYLIDYTAEGSLISLDSQNAVLQTFWQKYTLSHTPPTDSAAKLALQIGGDGTITSASPSVEIFRASLTSPTYRPVLHKALAAADSDSDGRLRVEIWPEIRGAGLRDGDRVIVNNPKGAFLLADASSKWTQSGKQFYGIAFNLMELVR